MKARNILWLAVLAVVACDAAAPPPQAALEPGDCPFSRLWEGRCWKPGDPLMTTSLYIPESWAERDFCREEEEAERRRAEIDADPSHPEHPLQLARRHAEWVAEIRSDPSHPQYSIRHLLADEYIEREPRPWLSYCKNPRPFRTGRIYGWEITEENERLRREWEAKHGPALRGAK